MVVGEASIRAFRRRVRAYYRRHGRDLPWRRSRDPYRIMVSEIMLQQTQADRVNNFYPKFLRRFPTLSVLAKAPLAEILRAWQGLGYNRRAVFLQKIARRAANEYGGRVPQDPEILATFPGIGHDTAGAIAAFAFNRPIAFIETNIRRVYIHFFFPRRRRVPDGALLPLIAQTMNHKNPREWYYALMDYGAMLGAVQKGKKNPNRRSRHYTRQSRFEGSDRQIRAGIVKLFLAKNALTQGQIFKTFVEPQERIEKILGALEKEGLVSKSGAYYQISV